MTSRSYLIDEPSPFADRATWEAHLEAMRGLHERDPHPDVAAAIKRAEEALVGDDLAWVESRRPHTASDADLQPLVEAFKAAQKGR